jgi:uncharacterized membrane protein
MTDGTTPIERLVTFSDCVFSVIITIMVLDLRPPGEAKLSALLPLWPTALSYAVSYLFIAIIWINHHRLLLFAHSATPKLMWWNFAHLFVTSLIPFSTAWISATKLAAGPVVFYAAVFVVVNTAFLGYQQEILSQATDVEVSPSTRHLSSVRALITLGIFALAACVAFWFPWAGFGLVCCVLLVYLRPQVPGEGLERHAQRVHSASIPAAEPDKRKETP